jgi:hypothetical protein
MGKAEWREFDAAAIDSAETVIAAAVSTVGMRTMR